MMLEFGLGDNFRNDIHRTIEQATAELVKDFADEAPEQFRRVLDNPPPSSEGNAPAKRSGKLMRTLQARVVDSDEVIIEMESYAGHLDPLFEDNNYNRPFIMRGIAKSISELEK